MTSKSDWTYTGTYYYNYGGKLTKTADHPRRRNIVLSEILAKIAVLAFCSIYGVLVVVYGVRIYFAPEHWLINIMKRIGRFSTGKDEYSDVESDEIARKMLLLLALLVAAMFLFGGLSMVGWLPSHEAI